MNIINVDRNLIEKTSNFAKSVFIDYYTDLIGLKQTNYMADLFLSCQAIEKLINDGAIFKLVLDNNEILGFCEYIKEKDRVFLSKLYVRKDSRHKGIGKLMFDDCIKYAKDNNIKAIYLTVNKGNKPSIDIYNHLGFKCIDAVVNDIGNGYVMDDYIMEYTI